MAMPIFSSIVTIHLHCMANIMSNTICCTYWRIFPLIYSPSLYFHRNLPNIFNTSSEVWTSHNFKHHKHNLMCVQSWCCCCFLRSFQFFFCDEISLIFPTSVILRHWMIDVWKESSFLFVRNLSSTFEIEKFLSWKKNKHGPLKERMKCQLLKVTIHKHKKCVNGQV